MMKKLLLKIIPPKVLTFFAYKPLRLIKDIMDSKANFSYSQQGEDLVVSKIFNKKWGGFFIDVGAFDPKTYSNTYKLHLAGWTGINIEPNPDNFSIFMKKRKRDINLNIGINSEEGIINYYRFNNPAVNTFDKQHAESWRKVNGFILKDTIQIETYRLEHVLQANLPPNKEIDFMTIDVEGLDYNVLTSNDWNKYRPKLIVVENDYFSNINLKENRIFKFMDSIEYELYDIRGISLFFIDKNNKNNFD
jgi:FkbM family methyltransferase